MTINSLYGWITAISLSIFGLVLVADIVDNDRFGLRSPSAAERHTPESLARSYTASESFGAFMDKERARIYEKCVALVPGVDPEKAEAFMNECVKLTP